MSGVGIGQASALWLQDGVETGDEHVGGMRANSASLARASASPGEEPVDCASKKRHTRPLFFSPVDMVCAPFSRAAQWRHHIAAVSDASRKRSNLGLYTRARGRYILRSSVARPCIALFGMPELMCTPPLSSMV